MSDYKIMSSIKNATEDALREQFALDVLMGFSATEKFLPSKYFYDSFGSKIFEDITDVEEYYLTNCEFDVFHRNKSSLAEYLKGSHFNLIELGAGDGRKTKVLLDEFVEQGLDFEYLPLDISESAIQDLTSDCKERYSELKTYGVVAEYAPGLKWICRNREGRKVALFLGSNIGNFARTTALGFLRMAWNSLSDGDMMLIGFDLKKDIDIFLHAYNDSKGVTSRFNLNLLSRINRELGGQFDINKYQHYGTYNPQRGAMESYLISLDDQEVFVKELEKSFKFRAYEPVHVEYSYKYLPKDIQELASAAGFEIVENFSDQKNYYVDSLWRVKKDPL